LPKTSNHLSFHPCKIYFTYFLPIILENLIFVIPEINFFQISDFSS
jgi:hypothetical protein